MRAITRRGDKGGREGGVISGSAGWTAKGKKKKREKRENKTGGVTTVDTLALCNFE